MLDDEAIKSELVLNELGYSMFTESELARYADDIAAYKWREENNMSY